MVKLTIVGRVSDGLALAQGPKYIANEENNEGFSFYKQQGETILKEISRGALQYSKMTIRVDHHCFNYLVESGIAFITLSESSYPRKLVFHYLQDLLKEFQKFDSYLIAKITRPYSFVGFDSIIGNIRKQYVDTRTQANLSKLNANRNQDLDIVTQNLTQVLGRAKKYNSELYEVASSSSSQPSSSSIWGSPRLEVIAMKWTPVTIILVVLVFLLWTCLIMADSIVISGLA